MSYQIITANDVSICVSSGKSTSVNTSIYVGNADDSDNFDGNVSKSSLDVSVSDTWVKAVLLDKDTTCKELVIDVSENTETSERSSKIYCKNASKTSTNWINIVQEGKDSGGSQEQPLNPWYFSVNGVYNQLPPTAPIYVFTTNYVDITTFDYSKMNWLRTYMDRNVLALPTVSVDRNIICYIDLNTPTLCKGQCSISLYPGEPFVDIQSFSAYDTVWLIGSTENSGTNLYEMFICEVTPSKNNITTATLLKNCNYKHIQKP